MPGRQNLIPKEPRLEELCGMAALKKWGKELARDLAEYAAGRIAWSEVDPGALIFGEPGTGKTMFAKALAATCGVPLIATSYAQWQRSRDGHMGDVLKAMRADFKLARQYAPCILFIDEIEAVGTRETGGNNQRWYTGIITALNVEFNATFDHQGVVVIAAANYPDRIDPALLRAGRLDTKIGIPLPGPEDLDGIIRFHLKGEIPGANLRGLAVATVGMTGADVAKLVRAARRRARAAPCRPLRLDDLFDVLGEKAKDLPRDYLERIAIHEAGHAIAAVVLKMSSSVNVSLFHLAKGGATTFFDPTIQAITRKVVQRKIAVALAGRAAEQVILGEVTAGAGGSDTSDLGLANTLAFSAVARWGLASSDEPRWVGCAPEQIVASHRELADEAYELLRVAYDQALALIRRRTPHVRAIANALLKRRALAHADIVALLAEQPGARRAAAQRTRRKRA